jgi:hypothetical protein
MATAGELRAEALRFANEAFEERVGALVEASRGDADALLAAAESLSSPGTKAGTAEHIAFTYLSAAFKRVTAT